MAELSVNMPTTSLAPLHIGNYTLGETIGHGTFGKVKIAKHVVTLNTVAIKILNRQKLRSLEVVDKIRREIHSMKLFRHPHIVKLYHVISTPSDLFMIMEYVPGGELFDYIVTKGRLGEEEARKFFQQIISGIDYCHSKRVVHRDLKPENLLLDAKKDVKIADFGLSNMMNDGEFLTTACGSPNYAAPEVISVKMYAGPEVDVWSSGIILYALLCGHLPFDDEHVPSLFRKIKKGEFVIPDHMSAEVAGLLRRMLEVDPMKRITISQIFDHKWFTIDLPEYLCNKIDFETAQDNEIVDKLAEQFSMSTMLIRQHLQLDDEKSDVVIAYRIAHDESISATPSALMSHKVDISLSPRDNLDLSASQPGRMNVVLEQTEKATGGGRNLQKKGGRWHLGIRSGARPQDIMEKIYEIMKKLNFDWRTLNAYSVQCRKKKIPSGFVLIQIQLFQIDHKCFLVDFKSLSNLRSSSGDSDFNRLSSGEDSGVADACGFVGGDELGLNISDLRCHQTIEFFEMCSDLILELAQ